jgi:hypothetical protein
MKTNVSAMVLGVGMFLAPAPVFAHHSFAAEFDASQPITLKGTITKMEWVNPHSWLYIDVKDPDGKVVNWAIEFGAPNALFRRGWRKTDLPVGVEVTVEGYRAKDPSPTANASDVVLPDGKKLFAGSSGTGAPYDERDRPR